MMHLDASLLPTVIAALCFCCLSRLLLASSVSSPINASSLINNAVVDPESSNTNVTILTKVKNNRPNDIAILLSQQPPKTLPPRPTFDDVSPKNVTAVVGQSAVLRCRVKNTGDRTVSWMRKTDLHILTSNIHTYTGDGRFSIVHPESTDEWNLKIDYVQRRDAGVYECQVNTEPKINMAILLNVDAAQAVIHGAEDVYVKKGSTISLTCSVNVHSSPPGTVVWYQGSAVVDFESSRGGISLETERTESGTTSKLLVTKASLSDSGNYTCLPTNANPASVLVHVLNGEHPAAMQHGEHGAGSKLAIRTWTTILALLTIILR